MSRIPGVFETSLSCWHEKRKQPQEVLRNHRWNVVLAHAPALWTEMDSYIRPHGQTLGQLLPVSFLSNSCTYSVRRQRYASAITALGVLTTRTQTLHEDQFVLEFMFIITCTVTPLPGHRRRKTHSINTINVSLIIYFPV